MASQPRIPFNRPFFCGQELAQISEVFQSKTTSGDGPFSKKCQKILEESLGVAKALLTTSCTDALEMSALLLDLRPGDEFIVPSFTFVSTANAYALRGAKPVFCDIRPDTLNLDEKILEGLISPRTKAILPVHYAGVGCEMDAINAIASKNGIPVVEDNAHGLFARYKKLPLGTFGVMATQSFHETKNIICGEGGALLLNDSKYIERAEILREKGTDRSKFFRGQVDKYSWVDIGSSFLPSEILAAFLYAQLQVRGTIQAKRKAIWETYHRELKGWAASNNVGLPTVPSHCDQAYHLYYLMMPTLTQRQGLMQHLESRNIGSVFHYLPLHLSKMGARFGGRPGQCPVTEWASDRLLRLPFYNDMTPAEQSRVISEIHSFQMSFKQAA